MAEYRSPAGEGGVGEVVPIHDGGNHGDVGSGWLDGAGGAGDISNGGGDNGGGDNGGGGGGGGGGSDEVEWGGIGDDITRTGWPLESHVGRGNLSSDRPEVVGYDGGSRSYPILAIVEDQEPDPHSR